MRTRRLIVHAMHGRSITTLGLSLVPLLGLIASCALGAAPSPTPDPAYGTKAQLLADKLITGLGRDHVKAAAYAVTTVDGYVATLPDTAGFDPPPGDHLVLMVEVAGWWSPARHRCPVGPRCDGTAFVLAYDFTGDADLDGVWLDDPWSPDRDPPQPSLNDRFQELRQWGDPIPLSVGS